MARADLTAIGVLVGLFSLAMGLAFLVSDHYETQRIVRDCLEGKVLTPSAYCDRVIASQY
jgi:hypothetical protein